MDYKELGRTSEKVSALGLGSWGLGGEMGVEDRSRDIEAVGALRRGVDLGMSFIDTAEVYGAGHSEELVAEALRGVRDRIFIATKVKPDNLSYDRLLKAAEGSLRRLGVGCIDLYQVHWPNPHIPIPQTMRAMEHLTAHGKIRYVGVSNFTAQQTEEALNALSKAELVSNQVPYSLMDRRVEAELLPYCQKMKITLIAYSPLGRGRLFESGIAQTLREVAERAGRTPAQAALNWLISKPTVTAIPKAIRIEHVEENAQAAGWRLTAKDEMLLDEASAKTGRRTVAV